MANPCVRIISEKLAATHLFKEFATLIEHGCVYVISEGTYTGVNRMNSLHLY
jgi:hypothetical protein